VSQAAPVAPGFLTVPANSSTGNYAVNWGSVPSASLYELEEDTTSGFTGAVQVYRGAATSFQVTGRTSGTYYYRVRAVNVVGSSGWTVGGNPCVVTITAAAVHVEGGPGNPGATQEMPGSLGIPMLHLKVSAGAAQDIDVLSIRVNTTGTGDDSTEITAVRLIRDVDGDGAVGTGDVQAGMGTFSADEGNITFDTSAQPSVTAGSAVHYLVVCDFSGTAFTGSDFLLGGGAGGSDVPGCDIDERGDADGIDGDGRREDDRHVGDRVPCGEYGWERPGGRDGRSAVVRRAHASAPFGRVLPRGRERFRGEVRRGRDGG
jgi:hypothetical protein